MCARVAPRARVGFICPRKSAVFAPEALRTWQYVDPRRRLDDESAAGGWERWSRGVVQ